jgi:hypothetical protein
LRPTARTLLIALSAAASMMSLSERFFMFDFLRLCLAASGLLFLVAAAALYAGRVGWWLLSGRQLAARATTLLRRHVDEIATLALKFRSGKTPAA